MRPSAVLRGSQWIWFVFPALAMAGEPGNESQSLKFQWWEVYRWLLFVGQFPCLWLALSKSRAAATLRSKISLKIPSIAVLLLVVSGALEWDHEMMFYRTFWYVGLQHLMVLTLVSSLVALATGRLERWCDAWPRWAFIILVVLLFVVFALPTFKFLYDAVLPCA